ncbi:hypothetical protein KPATCC21470_0666 [Kitasatospora purpeofusca]
MFVHPSTVRIDRAAGPLRGGSDRWERRRRSASHCATDPPPVTGGTGAAYGAPARFAPAPPGRRHPPRTRPTEGAVPCPEDRARTAGGPGRPRSPVEPENAPYHPEPDRTPEPGIAPEPGAIPERRRGRHDRPATRPSGHRTVPAPRPRTHADAGPCAAARTALPPAGPRPRATRPAEAGPADGARAARRLSPRGPAPAHRAGARRSTGSLRPGGGPGCLPPPALRRQGGRWRARRAVPGRRSPPGVPGKRSPPGVPGRGGQPGCPFRQKGGRSETDRVKSAARRARWGPGIGLVQTTADSLRQNPTPGQ